MEGLRVTPSTPFPRPSTGQLLRAPGFETQPCLSFTAGKAWLSLATETQWEPGPRFVTPGSVFAALCHVHATPETVLMALTKCNFILTIFVQAFDFLIWKHTKHYSLIHPSTHLLSNSHVPGPTTQGRNKRSCDSRQGPMTAGARTQQLLDCRWGQGSRQLPQEQGALCPWETRGGQRGRSGADGSHTHSLKTTVRTRFCVVLLNWLQTTEGFSAGEKHDLRSVL